MATVNFGTYLSLQKETPCPSAVTPSSLPPACPLLYRLSLFRAIRINETQPRVASRAWHLAPSAVSRGPSALQRATEPPSFSWPRGGPACGWPHRLRPLAVERRVVCAGRWRARPPVRRRAGHVPSPLPRAAGLAAGLRQRPSGLCTPVGFGPGARPEIQGKKGHRHAPCPSPEGSRPLTSLHTPSFPPSHLLPKRHMIWKVLS